ncbi:MAG: RIP metalloprotease RseP [Desulfurella sp.]|uniref:RIP metalloprotease RseP n=1 Tax=Desulfurella sp. TaxID=1962857 RepID=UPI003C9EADE2
MYILYGILALIIMIIIHEFGHFIVAVLSGVKVERFSIGFGPVLFKKQTKITEFAFSAIPLGGYVKMKGEEPNSVDENDKEGAFYAQNVYKRMLIVFAGPFFNILSAVFFFAVAYYIGIQALAPQVGKVIKDSPAYYAHLQPKDKIIKINNISVGTWEDMSKIIKTNDNLNLVIKRDGKLMNLHIKPKSEIVKNLLGYKEKINVIGILPSGETTIVKYPLFKSLYAGVEKTVYIIKVTLEGIVSLIAGLIPSSEVGGPIMIVDIASKAAQAGLGSFLIFASIISINLGLLNLFPIPVLDGGHLMFFTIEAIRKKPVSEKFQIAAQKIGIGLLIALMIFAFYNDIKRFFIPKTTSTTQSVIKK